MRELAAPHCAGPAFAVTAKLFGRSLQFLVDTGAEVSALPASYKSKALPFDVKIRAANGTDIATFGCIAADIELPDLHRRYTSRFVVADVTCPILGADFFRRHGLLIDVAKRRVRDTDTQLCATLSMRNQTTPQLLQLYGINNELWSLLEKHAAVFDVRAPRPVPEVEFKIENTEIPPPARAYRLSPDKTAAAKQEIENEISLGRMERSSSEYAAPLFPVKKADGSWRFVADYTKLNRVTKKDNYMPPRIDDLLARIPQNSVFSKIDLQKAFFLIPVRQQDQCKTAVITPFGLYHYKVMPMGLKNATQTLQRYVDTVLRDVPGVIVYCDDILLFSDKDSHIQVLDTVLQKLRLAGLVINKSKSKFFQESVEFLGHRLSATAISPVQKRIEAILEFATPKTPRQVRRFIGTVNFFRKFVPGVSAILQPLTALTSNNKPFAWSDEAQASFETAKRSLANATSLTYISTRDSYTLTTDASSVAVGATLTSQNGPVGFFSSQLHGPELNYCTYDKELLAVHKAVKHFEWLLLGNRFVLRVDHKPLLHIFNKTASNERRRRHVQYLSEFDMEIQHIAGQSNIVADALSRDQFVDAFHLQDAPCNLPDPDMRTLQEADSTIMRIPAEHRTADNGVWRSTTGLLLVPQQHRSPLIKAVHDLSHAGAKSTKRQLQASYTWPGIHRDVTHYVAHCLDCQQSKITKHTKPEFKNYGSCDNFSVIHIDFVGPLPQVNGKRYLVTIFDRATRYFYAWPKASPTALSAVEALTQWVSFFGVPSVIVTDQGTHFEALLFKEAVSRLGIEKRRTTAYHPASNGAVERQHRRLKAALKCRSTNAQADWLRLLPFVLLGLNNSVSEDSGVSSAQAVYGRLLNIPNCMFQQQQSPICTPLERQYQQNPSYVPKQLASSDYVWLRQERATNLQRPYQGPYKILQRNFANNTFLVDVGHSSQWINLHRLKPALILA